jgi:hypothetical protein
VVERIIETVLIVALNILVIGAGIGAYRALR